MGWLIIVGAIALPVAEIMVWIRSAELIGVWPTILLSVAAVMIGTAILRRQGLAMLLDARARMEQGELPLETAFDGLCLAAAGFLLVLPGFITDVMALPLLLPPVRRRLRRWVGRRLSGPADRSFGPVVIDTEFQVIEPDPPPDRKRLEP